MSLLPRCYVVWVEFHVDFEFLCHTQFFNCKLVYVVPGLGVCGMDRFRRLLRIE